MDTAHTSHCPHCFDALPSTPCAHCGWEPGADNPPPSLALGTLLDGRYRIGRVLGHGGFGITYLARDENLQLRLAIKEYLPRDCATRAPDGVSLAIYSGQAGEQFAYGLDRFLDEARALARFDQHPGIVTVKSFFRAHGTGYCVMDYVEGLTLKHYLERQPGGRLPVGQAWLLLQPVMDALRAVHKDGLLHRDLAPDNIYITLDGRVKLLDFGAARFAAGEHSRSLSVILKPGYAPEEQYRSRGKQGPWTDVYGLAATLYRAITGTVPPEALDRLDQDELAAPSQLGIAISATQEAALLKALAIRSEQRFPNVATLQKSWHEAPPTDSDPKDHDRNKIISNSIRNPEKIPAPCTVNGESSPDPKGFGWYLVALSHYAQFEGRARRKEYWLFLLFHSIFIFALGIVDGFSGSFYEGSGIGLLSGIYLLATAIPSLAVLVRRLHDTNRSGWWLLIGMVPYVGVFIIFLFSLIGSAPGDNRYGRSPLHDTARASSKREPILPQRLPERRSRSDLGWILAALLIGVTLIFVGFDWLKGSFDTHSFPISIEASSSSMQGQEPVAQRSATPRTAPTPLQSSPQQQSRIAIYYAGDLPPQENIPPEAPLCYKFLVSGIEEQLIKLKRKYPGLYGDQIFVIDDGGKSLVAKRRDPDGKEVLYFYSTSPAACSAYQQQKTVQRIAPFSEGNYRVTKNQHGAVLESDGERLYLGNDCDAYSPKYGKGTWGWSNAGFDVKFRSMKFGFPRHDNPLDSPDCAIRN